MPTPRPGFTLRHPAPSPTTAQPRRARHLRAAALAAGLLAAGPAMAFSLTVRPTLAGYQDTLAPATGRVDPTVASSATYASATYQTQSPIACTTASTTNCTRYAPGGSRIELVWTGGDNTVFAGWSGCNSASGTTCTVLLNSDRIVTPSYRPATYEVRARTSPVPTATWTPPYGGRLVYTASGLGDSIDCRTGAAGTDCVGAVPSGATVTFLAVPDPGTSRVKAWSGCTPATSDPPTCTLLSRGPTSVTVTFEAAPTAPKLVTIQVAGGGSVTSPSGSCTPTGGACTTSVPYGGSVTLTAVPSQGSRLGGWTGCDGSTDTTCTLTNVTADRAVTATFKAATCSACHGTPPVSHAPTLTSCGSCHDGYTAWSVNPEFHANGTVEISGAACTMCHGFAPATGAHAAHFGLVGPETSSYGDTRTLSDMFPAETPTSAPSVYAFGCGLCHPLDFAKHDDGTVDVVLYDAAASQGSLKRRSAATAAYDGVTGTCSGVYCHSTGQATPAYRTTPAWASGTSLTCGDCHDNPPRYASGGPGAETANSHVNLADDGYEFGHFGGMIGPWLFSQHGQVPNYDAAPITCQTCHSQTVDPGNTGPSGFYYLDTTGNYQLPGGDPYRIGTSWYRNLQCTNCHSAANALAPVQAGRVLPLRHVNGARDVSFDARETLPAISWLPPAPSTPVKPYWFTGGTPGMADWAGVDVTWSGTTPSWSLSTSTYDPATKTCTNVACHMAEDPQWGRPYQYYTNDSATCYACHPNL